MEDLTLVPNTFSHDWQLQWLPEHVNSLERASCSYHVQYLTAPRSRNNNFIAKAIECTFNVSSTSLILRLHSFANSRLHGLKPFLLAPQF